jgi:hypothetical protein
MLLYCIGEEEEEEEEDLFVFKDTIEGPRAPAVFVTVLKKIINAPLLYCTWKDHTFLEKIINAPSAVPFFGTVLK